MSFGFGIGEVIVMLIATQVFGMLFYGPLFGKVWSKAMSVPEGSVSKKELQKKSLQHASMLLLQIIGIGFLLPLVVINPFALAFIIWGAVTVPGIVMGVIWENTPRVIALLNLVASLVVLFIIIGIYVWLG